MEPDLRKLPIDCDAIGKNLVLVNSGIPRAADLGLHRGLNMRFWAYLSRNPFRYKAILQSYQIHEEIVQVFSLN